MTTQKSKTVIATTAAVVLVLLLGGVSLTLFPEQAPAKPSTSILNSFVPTSLSSTYPLKNHAANSSSSSNSSNSIVGEMFLAGVSPTLMGIAIEKDGSINSTAAPIERNGDTYTLTGNLDNRTLIIQKDNIVLDGNGYTVEGFNSGFDYAYEAIDLRGVINVTVENFNVDSFWQPIQVHDSSQVRIEASNITNCPSYAIELDSCNYTLVSNNFLEGTISVTNVYGEAASTYNSIVNNTLVDMAEGIQIYQGSHNTVSGNNLTNVYDDIGTSGDSSVISNNIIVNGIDGIFAGQDTIIEGNVLFNMTDVGIGVYGQNNRIYANTVENAKYGVCLQGSTSTDLENTTFYGNNFINNTENLQSNPSVTVQWDMGKEGNYWSSYNGTERNSDGVGDTPYNIGGNNTDYYPFMQPPTVAQAAAVNSPMGHLFFTLAVIAGAAGLAASICLYVRSLKGTSKKSQQHPA